MDYSILSRSYDLRGVYPDDIDEDLYFRIGYALVKHTGKTRIMIGHDARLSGPTLFSACIQGILSAGGHPIAIGFCSSDMLAFGTNYYPDVEVGVMITASHNPKNQNGLKASYHGGQPINLKHEGALLAQYAESCTGHWDADFSLQRSEVEWRNIVEDWTDHILSFSSTRDFSALKVVMDGGNGAAGAFLSQLARKMNIEMIPLFLDPDGNFPNHHPNPMLSSNRMAAKQKVIETGADLALLFDGDADRVVILDRRGEMVVSGIICSIIASALLTQHPGKTIAGNAVISHTLADTVEAMGGTYIRTRVDSVAIKDMMLKNPDILFAGEHSTHYFVQKNWSMDSGIVAAVIFLDILIASGLSLDDFIAKYTRYITLEETNFRVTDPAQILAVLQKEFAHAPSDTLDGLTVYVDEGTWWNIRVSNNEPVMRLNMESKNQEMFDATYQTILDIMLQNGAEKLAG